MEHKDFDSHVSCNEKGDRKRSVRALVLKDEACDQAEQEVEDKTAYDADTLVALVARVNQAVVKGHKELTGQHVCLKRAHSYCVGVDAIVGDDACPEDKPQSKVQVAYAI